jgi:hypothetical protein
MARQPVVLRVLAGEQVVQDDRCLLPDDGPFHATSPLEDAQIVTPLVRDGQAVAILLHELAGPRRGAKRRSPPAPARPTRSGTHWAGA